jgi:hypothetical protein
LQNDLREVIPIEEGKEVLGAKGANDSKERLADIRERLKNFSH